VPEPSIGAAKIDRPANAIRGSASRRFNFRRIPLSSPRISRHMIELRVIFPWAAWVQESANHAAKSTH
jgi:hypothetical protein